LACSAGCGSAQGHDRRLLSVFNVRLGLTIGPGEYCGGVSCLRERASAIAVREAAAGDADAVIEVVRTSITQLCAADHRHDPETLATWLANKTPEIFSRGFRIPTTSASSLWSASGCPVSDSFIAAARSACSSWRRVRSARASASKSTRHSKRAHQDLLSRAPYETDHYSRL
jgi:hypothetical protein